MWKPCCLVWRRFQISNYDQNFVFIVLISLKQIIPFLISLYVDAVHLFTTMFHICSIGNFLNEKKFFREKLFVFQSKLDCRCKRPKPQPLLPAKLSSLLIWESNDLLHLETKQRIVSIRVCQCDKSHKNVCSFILSTLLWS